MGQARRKVRRVGKWVGLVIVLLVLGVDVGSIWFGLRVSLFSDRRLVVRSGGVVDSHWLPNTMLPSGDGFYRHDAEFQWRPMEWTFSLGWSKFYPIWILALPLAALTTWLWHLDRSKPGVCSACNYDLTGLAPGSTCPECGKGGVISSPAPEKS